MRRYLILSVAIVVGAAGCGEQLSIPVPQPVPLKIRKSTPGADQSQVVVAGLPQAVEGKGRVRVRDQQSGTQVTSPSTEQGSFVAILKVGAAADLYARYETDNGVSAEVPLTVRTLGVPPVLVRSRGPRLVSAPDGQGMVRVSNDAGAGQPPLVSASPNSEVIVGNATRGSVVTTRTDGGGRFTLSLPGGVGDAIQIFLVNIDDAALSSDFLDATVPAS